MFMGAYKGQIEFDPQDHMSLWLNNRNWNEEPFVLFSYRPLKEAVGLNPDQKHFSFQTLMTNSALGDVVRTAHQKTLEEQALTRDEREALSLEDRLTLMLASVDDNTISIVPHPTDAKGKWLGITEDQTFYADSAIAPLVASFAAMKQLF